jgi:hypothetical protein
MVNAKPDAHCRVAECDLCGTRFLCAGSRRPRQDGYARCLNTPSASRRQKRAGPTSPAKFYGENKGVVRETPSPKGYYPRQGRPFNNGMAHNVRCAKRPGAVTKSPQMTPDERKRWPLPNQRLRAFECIGRVPAGAVRSIPGKNYEGWPEPLLGCVTYPVSKPTRITTETGASAFHRRNALKRRWFRSRDERRLSRRRAKWAGG